ncbi:hypothetical protein ACOMHN_043081 [Nucella lapillus]
MRGSEKTMCIKMVRKNCDPEKRKYVLREQKVLAEHCRASPFTIRLNSCFQTAKVLADRSRASPFIIYLNSSFQTKIHHNVPYNKAVDYWAMGVLLYTLIHGQSPFYGKTRVALFKAVTAEKEVYDIRYGENTVSLCRALLQKNQKNRLGFEEESEIIMKTHPFFSDVMWERMERMRYLPPYIPDSAESIGEELTEMTWPKLPDQNAMFSSTELCRQVSLANSCDRRLSIIELNKGSVSVRNRLEK